MLFTNSEVSEAIPCLGSIKADRESLNLDVAQTRETEQSARRADESLDAKIQEAYSWLLYPRIDLFSGSMDIEWGSRARRGRRREYRSQNGAKTFIR